MSEIKNTSTRTEATASLKSRIAEFINDTATLDVITLSGSIKLVTDAEVNPQGDKDIFNWDEIFKKVATGLKADESTEVSIVAYTHAEWDQDSVNYVARDADMQVVEAHGKTVAAAHEARMNALKSAVEVVKKLF